VSIEFIVCFGTGVHTSLYLFHLMLKKKKNCVKDSYSIINLNTKLIKKNIKEKHVDLNI
jgi:hypothetical protein